ncbi:MAG: HAD-IA family hydrolase [Acidobacteria bacterium]|nr:HAD-IA family hydrolase [Acidobacteriota bacterium]
MPEQGGPPERVDIEVAVFDLLGTTVADNDVVQAAVKAAAGVRFDPVVFQRFRGASKREMLAALVGDAHADAAHAEFEVQLLRAAQRDVLQPFPDAKQCLRDVRLRGIRICLITGFSRTMRETILSHLGWDTLVDLALSPEDAGRGRPAPDLILTAALRLRANDVRAVAVVGDTTNDLLAAAAAGSGIRAAVLTGAHPEAALRAVPHTHVLNRVSDLVPAIDQWTA